MRWDEIWVQNLIWAQFSSDQLIMCSFYISFTLTFAQICIELKSECLSFSLTSAHFWSLFQSASLWENHEKILSMNIHQKMSSTHFFKNKFSLQSQSFIYEAKWAHFSNDHMSGNSQQTHDPDQQIKLNENMFWWNA